MNAHAINIRPLINVVGTILCPDDEMLREWTNRMFHAIDDGRVESLSPGEATLVAELRVITGRVTLAN